jgi:hypothetical protein
MLSGKRLETIDIVDIRALIEMGHREDREIDYKRDLPDLDGRRGADAKKDLLKDTAAFANAGGGDLVFGVEEERDGQGKPNGVPSDVPGIELENVDALERRWLEVLDYSLDPRMVPKPRVWRLDIPESTRKVLILRIPRSIAAPHMIKETGWFYSRPGPFALPMSTGEIRAAFNVSDGWARRVRSFRDERIGRVVGGDQPVAIHGGDSLLVMHVVPFSSLLGGKVDLHTLKRQMPTPVAPSPYGGGVFTAFNVDGVMVATDQREGTAYSYTEYFRDGCAEFVVPVNDSSGPGKINLRYVEENAIKGVAKLIPALVNAGASYPFAITFALTGVRGKRAFWTQYHDGPHPPLTRDLVCLEDVVAESEIDAGEAASFLRPVFDGMWQCFGHDRSTSYDAAGNRTSSRP